MATDIWSYSLVEKRECQPATSYLTAIYGIAIRYYGYAHNGGLFEH